MRTVLMLVASNLFMTFAWYWHFKARTAALPLAGFILISWAIALPEYCLAVPANRFGLIKFGGAFSEAQLKVMQEGISILVWLVFALVYLRTTPRWQELVGLALILAGLAVALWPRPVDAL